MIARIPTIALNNRRLYFLRLLLMHVPGATSFKDLQTINGEDTGSFEEAAKRLNLLEDDQEWTRVLEEAVTIQMPKEMRVLFATICANCSPNDPITLWETFRDAMCEDIQYRFPDIPQNDVHNIGLYEIKKLLAPMGMALIDLGLDEPAPLHHSYLSFVNNNIGQIVYNIPHERRMCEQMKIQLNAEQLHIFEQVEQALIHHRECRIFIDGPGGSGKTFLYKAICHLVRGRGETIFATAWSGLAASLLEGGQTCHSRFGLPVPFTNESTTRFSAGSDQARAINNARVILGDEASIIPGHFLIELDRLLKDFSTVLLTFGNKIILTSGDFRQTLPVCPGATRTQIIAQCINQTDLFRQAFTKFSLTQNMRVNPEEMEFKSWLMDLGNGQLPRYENMPPDLILLPERVVLNEVDDIGINGQSIKRPANENDLIDFVFDKPFNKVASYEEGRAILCPLNEDSLNINETVLDKLDGLPFIITLNKYDLNSNYISILKVKFMYTMPSILWPMSTPTMMKRSEHFQWSYCIQ